MIPWMKVLGFAAACWLVLALMTIGALVMIARTDLQGENLAPQMRNSGNP